MAGDVREEAHEAGDDMKDAAHNAESTKQAARDTKSAAQDAAAETRAETREARDDASEQARDAKTDAEDAARDAGRETREAAGTTGQAVTDGWITTKVKSSFVGVDALDGSDINVDTSGLSLSFVEWLSERGARVARREERAYREYSSDEQRRQSGCPARQALYK